MSAHPPSTSPSGLSSEAELILSVTRCCAEPEKRERIRTVLRQSIDWEFVLNLASQHRLLPPLYLSLKDAANESVPPPVQAILKSEYDHNAIHNLLLAQELIRIQQLLRINNIPVIAYKGVTLAVRLYGSLASRHVWDIDLLVKKKHIVLIKSLLIENGYRPAKQMTDEEEQKFLEKYCEYHFERVDGKANLDLHWEVIPDGLSSIYNSNHIWECTQEIKIAGESTLTIRPEELLIYLCVHGDKHGWWRLKWLCDIALLISHHPNLDWNRVMSLSRNLKEENIVGFGLYLALVLLNAPLPSDVTSRLKVNSQYKLFMGLVVGRMFREGFGLPGFSEWKRYIDYFAENKQDSSCGTAPHSVKFGSYLRAVIQPEWSDQCAFTLPSWLAFLHYFLRPLRLFRTHKQRLLWRLR